MKIQNSKIKNQKSFTLIELLVSVVIFLIIISMTSGFFVSALRSQRRILPTQELLDQVSYVLEYMGRALRMAKKDLTGSCITAGHNYGTTPNGIKFIDYNNNCTEYYLDAGQLKKRIGANSWELTSSKIKVNQFRISLSGVAQPPTDNLQPRATIFLEALGRGREGEQPKIQIQTTISQRKLDIQY